MIGFDSDLTIRREIDRVLQLHGVEVSVVMEFDNIETIKRAIEIDAGVGLLPEPTVLREVEAGTLVAVPLATDELVRPLGIIHRRGKELSSTARRFIELLQSEAASRSPANRPSSHGRHCRTAAAGRMSGDVDARTAERSRRMTPRAWRSATAIAIATASGNAPAASDDGRTDRLRTVSGKRRAGRGHAQSEVA